MIFEGDTVPKYLDPDLVAEAWYHIRRRPGLSRIDGTGEKADRNRPRNVFLGHCAEIGFNLFAWDDIGRFLIKTAADDRRGSSGGGGDGGRDYGNCDIKSHGHFPGVELYAPQDDSMDPKTRHTKYQQAVCFRDEHRDHRIYVYVITEHMGSGQDNVDEFLEKGIGVRVMGWVRGMDMIEKTVQYHPTYDRLGSFYKMVSDLEPLSILKREWFEEDKSKW